MFEVDTEVKIGRELLKFCQTEHVVALVRIG
jgi:hypothetical protein